MTRAVVMAAGEGRRLRPLSERWAKPVLPIDGRPVLPVLLRELAAAGIERVTVVVGHLAHQVRALAGDGAAFGLELAYATQPRPEGSADAVRRAQLEPPYLVTAADTLFTPGDLARFAEAVARTEGAVAVRRSPAPSPPHRYAVRAVDGRVERVLDEDPRNELAAAPLWWVGPRVAAHLCEDEPPHELGNAFQAAVDEGAEIRAVEIGATRDLTDPFDVVEENFAYLAGMRP